MFFKIGPKEEEKELTDKEIKLLDDIYFNPKTGYCGINELMRKSKLSQNKVEKYLIKQDTYTKHVPIRKKFETRRVLVDNIDEQFQADLVEMIPYSKENKEFKYILTVIDCFSKYAWAIKVKDKKGNSILEAFKIIFKDRKPKSLQTDYGKEFYNKTVQKYLKSENINHFSTNSQFKACIVERFNRTLKEKMWKYFSEIGNKTWIDILDDLVYNYNNSYHTSIKMTPIEASKKINENIVWLNLFEKKKTLIKKPKFKIGDKVRITKYKNIFKKGYEQNYTTEIFLIKEILNSIPITYKLKDYKDEDIRGIFYEQELVKFDKEDKEFEIEKVLKTKKINGKIMYFIKWKGYPKSMNSWVNKINN